MSTRQYAFSWDYVGNVHDGRPNLGNSARIEVYRLFQYTLRDVIEARYGTDESEEVMRESGKLAGRKFCERFVGRRERFGDFLAAAQKALLGKLSPEQVKSTTLAGEAITQILDRKSVV